MFGHPKGLVYLFLTELWERFSYYGMRAILVLYLTATTQKGGLGWSDEHALRLYGFYTALVYLMSIPGGIIADKWLGKKKSVMVGGLLLVLGHILMAVPSMVAFYAALSLIVSGVGMLKPNISSMVGDLYDLKDKRRDRGFVIFYMGINIGGAVAPIAVTFLALQHGWHYGFGLAGAGMVLGQIIYLMGQKTLITVGSSLSDSDEYSRTKETVASRKNRYDQTTLYGIILFVLPLFGFVFLQEGGYWNLTEQSTFFAQYLDTWFTKVLLVILLTLGLGLILFGKQNNEYQPPLTGKEKDRIALIGICLIVVMIFWAAFEQAGGLLNLYTEKYTDRSSIFGEIPTGFFQSINSIFIILIGSAFVAFLAYLSRRDIRFTSIEKFGLGPIILGIGFIALIGSVLQGFQGDFIASLKVDSEPIVSSSMAWIIAFYFMQTVGELFISPISLSYITKLSPKRYSSRMMGWYFGFTGLGNYAAGELGAQSSKLGAMGIFLVIFAFTIFFGSMIWLFRKKLSKLSHGID